MPFPTGASHCWSTAAPAFLSQLKLPWRSESASCFVPVNQFTMDMQADVIGPAMLSLSSHPFEFKLSSSTVMIGDG